MKNLHLPTTAKRILILLEDEIVSNPYIFFEIGTEYGIRPLTIKDIGNLIYACKISLKPEIFKQILFCVIQSGTETKQGTNIGVHNSDIQSSMNRLVKTNKLYSVEHNFDYLSNDEMQKRFDIGLDCANIAPAIASIESETLYNHMNNQQILQFYNIVYNSKKWIKWFPSDFNPDFHKKELIIACGHYVFSYPEFISLKSELRGIDEIIKNNIITYLKSIYNL